MLKRSDTTPCALAQGALRDASCLVPEVLRLRTQPPAECYAPSTPYAPCSIHHSTIHTNTILTIHTILATRHTHCTHHTHYTRHTHCTHHATPHTHTRTPYTPYVPYTPHAPCTPRRISRQTPHTILHPATHSRCEVPARAPHPEGASRSGEDGPTVQQVSECFCCFFFFTPSRPWACELPKAYDSQEECWMFQSGIRDPQSAQLL